MRCCEGMRQPFRGHRRHNRPPTTGGLLGDVAWLATGVVMGHRGAGAALLCAAYVRPRRGGRARNLPGGPESRAPRYPERRRGRSSSKGLWLVQRRSGSAGTKEETPSVWLGLRPWRRGSGCFVAPAGPSRATGRSSPMPGAGGWRSSFVWRGCTTTTQCAAGLGAQEACSSAALSGDRGSMAVSSTGGTGVDPRQRHVGRARRRPLHRCVSGLGVKSYHALCPVPMPPPAPPSGPDQADVPDPAAMQ